MTKFQRNFLIIAGIIALLLGVAMAVQLIGNGKQAETDMTLFDDFKADAEHVEGRQYKVYRLDGILHVGIGHKLTEPEWGKYKVGYEVTDEEIDAWFKHDYDIVMHGVAKYFHDFDSYPHLVKLAILNWLYQLGEDAPRKFPLATAAIIARDWNTAADNWLYVSVRTRRYSKWHHQTPTRCEQEVGRLRHAAQHELEATHEH